MKRDTILRQLKLLNQMFSCDFAPSTPIFKVHTTHKLSYNFGGLLLFLLANLLLIQ